MPASRDAALTGDVLDPLEETVSGGVACAECGRVVVDELVRALEHGVVCAGCDEEGWP